MLSISDCKDGMRNSLQGSSATVRSNCSTVAVDHLQTTIDGFQQVYRTAQMFGQFSEESYKLKCNMCDKMFTNASNLHRHQTLHIRPNQYMCSLCSKSFTRVDNLKRHIFLCHKNTV